jgi:uncharacterized protein YodC (DUF2158 family)
MSEIKEGAVVALSANDMYAPSMTVGKIKDGKAECLWFVGKELRRAHIPVAALKFLRE